MHCESSPDPVAPVAIEPTSLFLQSDISARACCSSCETARTMALWRSWRDNAPGAMALKLVVMLLLVWQGVGAATYRAERLGWGAAGSFPPPWEQHQWAMAGTPPSTSTVRLVLALTKQPGGEVRLTEALLAASTPSSARYGTWLTRDQVRGMVAHTQCPDHVTAWLRRQAGVSEVTVGEVGDTVRVALTVKATEVWLSTVPQTCPPVLTVCGCVWLWLWLWPWLWLWL